MDVIKPSHIERQVTQLKGLFSFLVGNLLIKIWKNSWSAKANPETHSAFSIVIIIYILNSHLYPNAVSFTPLQHLEIPPELPLICLAASFTPA
jgi:hypothetical protein